MLDFSGAIANVDNVLMFYYVATNNKKDNCSVECINENGTNIEREIDLSR